MVHYCREFIEDFNLRADVVFVRAARLRCSFEHIDSSFMTEIQDKIDEWREDYDPSGEFADVTAEDLIWQM